MKSTPAMRERIHELMGTDAAGIDDYDRAVRCVLEDVETLEAALRDIARGENSFFGMMKIARGALRPEQDK